MGLLFSSLQWENKKNGCRISEAVDDIHSKTAVWTSLYYGDIKVRAGRRAAVAQGQVMDGRVWCTRRVPTYDLTNRQQTT
jgi:hypothetical protein